MIYSIYIINDIKYIHISYMMYLYIYIIITYIYIYQIYTIYKYRYILEQLWALTENIDGLDWEYRWQISRILRQDVYVEHLKRTWIINVWHVEIWFFQTLGRTGFYFMPWAEAVLVGLLQVSAPCLRLSPAQLRCERCHEQEWEFQQFAGINKHWRC